MHPNFLPLPSPSPRPTIPHSLTRAQILHPNLHILLDERIDRTVPLEAVSEGYDGLDESHEGGVGGVVLFDFGVRETVGYDAAAAAGVAADDN